MELITKYIVEIYHGSGELRDDDLKEENEDTIMNDNEANDNILFDIAADADHIDQEILDFNNPNPEWMLNMIEEENPTKKVPRSKLNGLHEMMYFDDCCKVFQRNYPDIFRKWKDSLNVEIDQSLNECLKNATKVMERYSDRQRSKDMDMNQRKKLMKEIFDVKIIKEMTMNKFGPDISDIIIHYFYCIK